MAGLVPVDYDPFFGASGAAGAPEPGNLLSRYVGKALGNFGQLGYDVANTLLLNPLGQALQTTSDVLEGKGFTPEEATNAAGLAILGSIGRGGLGAGPRLPNTMLDQPAANRLLSAAEGVPSTAGGNSLMAPIRAYHGSPYDFDAFDLSKIGTGEGSQAYGHGIYVAEHPDVAQSYRDALAGINSNITARSYLSKAQGDSDLALKLFQEHRQKGIFGNADNALLDEVEKALSGGRGTMYEVNLHADPDTFLHWDKPLSEQPEPVKQALEKMLPADKPMTAEDLAKHFLNTQYAQNFPNAADVRKIKRILSNPDYPEELAEWAAVQKDKRSSAFNLVGPVGAVPSTSTGGQIYKRMGNPVEAMQALRDAGISGIKYLDQGSRAAGEGTSNFVVFDPKVVEIVRKYGLAPLIAGGMTTIGGNVDAAQHLLPVDHEPDFIEPPPKDGGTYDNKPYKPKP